MAAGQDPYTKGTLLLDEALKLVVECETEIKPKHRKVLEEKVLGARAKGLDLLNSPSRFNCLRYKRAAHDALKYAKAVSRRAQTQPESADNSANPRISAFDLQNTPRLTLHELGDRLNLSVQRLYRCHLSYRNAFPIEPSMNQCIQELWDQATIQTGIMEILTPEDLPKVCKLVTCSALWHLICLKAKLRLALESSLSIVADPSSSGPSNTDSSTTFSKASDIYECRQDNQPLCQHCITQRAINVLWFQKMNDECKGYQKSFLSLPIPAVALAFTVIQCCVDERANGNFHETSWAPEEKYNGHRDSINRHERGLDENVADAMRRGFLRNAR